MGRRLDWEAANRRDRGKPTYGRSSPRLPTKEITDRQRRYITALARKCGVEAHFFGNTGAASCEINRLKALLAAKNALEADATEPRAS